LGPPGVMRSGVDVAGAVPAGAGTPGELPAPLLHAAAAQAVSTVMSPARSGVISRLSARWPRARCLLPDVAERHAPATATTPVSAPR
jgi:hypothetical protein